MMKRNGVRWSISEILQLQRECELLKLSVCAIARIHKRTKRAIEMKIDFEGFE